MNHEFDRHAADYSRILDTSVALSGYDARYFDEYKIREIHRVLASSGILTATPRILNFGCGIGKSEQICSRYFPGCLLFSTDISPESVRIATKENSTLTNAVFAVSDGRQVPFDEMFDIIFCAGVFHHIPENERIPVLSELLGKLSPNGRLFVFEHNPWNPVTRRVVESCPLDVNARLITPPEMTRLLRQAGFSRIMRRFIVFFPRSLRLLAPLERLLGWCPLGAQYYCCASRDDMQ